MRKIRVRLPMPLWFAALLAALAVLAWFTQYAWLPQGLHLVDASSAANRAEEIAPISAVRLSEVMAANRTAWSGANGRYPDWAELVNAGNSPIDITGWTLTDRQTRGMPFTFPELTLAPGEMVLVSFTGALKNRPGAGFEAPFRLNAQGDALMLFDGSGMIMESINVPALGRNQVYARDAETGRWQLSDAYTPGLLNTAENHRLLTEPGETLDSPVVINELMPGNRSTLKDQDGDYSDWIELYNAGATPVNLSDYYLSDNPDRPLRYRLPDVVLKPGAYLVIFASGKDQYTPGGEIHANFKLGAEGETVVLASAQGRQVAAVGYALLKDDQSYARQADGRYATGAPSPNRPNG